MLEFGHNESWLLQDDSASAAKYIARYVSLVKINARPHSLLPNIHTYVVNKGVWSKGV